MRSNLTILLWLAAGTGSAQASSFVTIEPLREKVSPSIVVFGTPRPAPAAVAAEASAPRTNLPKVPLAFPLPGEAGTPRPRAEAYVVPAPRMISPSIVAFGAPAVSFETLAAIGGKAPARGRRGPPGALPLVIRGGIVDTGAAAPVAIPAPAKAAPEEPRTTVAAPPAPRGPAREPRPEPERAPPPPAPPPAAPTREPE